MTPPEKLQAAADVFTRNTMKTLQALHPDERRPYLVFLLHEVGDKPWMDPLRDMLSDMDHVEEQIKLWVQGRLRFELREEGDK